MRSLREKLMAVSSSKATQLEGGKPVRTEPYFCRESVVPLSTLRGIEETTLEEILACDPAFEGKKRRGKNCVQ